jgi:D-alanyl-D-alanine carboxypeptidase
MVPKEASPAPHPVKNQQKTARNTNSASMAAERILFFFAAIAAGAAVTLAANDGQARFEDYLYAQISQPIENIAYVAPKDKEPPQIDLDAKAAYSLRIGANGREKTIIKENTDAALPIASLTKLMTAVVVFENPDTYNLERSCAISQTAASQDNVPVAGNLTAGEIYTVRQLLDMMLHYSSNDAAWALSEMMVNGDFVSAMNRKAADVGLFHTIYYNPTGLDRDDGNVNVSNADDLMVLTKYILQTHPEIFSATSNHELYATENGLFDLNLWDGQKLVGGKTGYTEKAGGCMVVVFENEKHRQYINILLGSTSPETRVVQMQKMINSANNFDAPTQ